MKHKIVEYKKEYFDYLYSDEKDSTVENDYKLLYLYERWKNEVLHWRLCECKAQCKHDKAVLKNKLQYYIDIQDTDYINNIAKFIVEVCNKMLKSDVIPSNIINTTADEMEAWTVWELYLKEMITGFTLLRDNYNYSFDLTEDEQKQVDRALYLFTQYYQSLWE